MRRHASSGAAQGSCAIDSLWRPRSSAPPGFRCANATLDPCSRSHRGPTPRMFLASDSASMLAVAAGVCGAIVVASAKGGRVLFMDDEEAITMMAEKVVRRLGYDFESAADGMEAIEKYRAARNSGSPFDLVVLDLTIPGGMGGREAMATRSNGL